MRKCLAVSTTYSLWRKVLSLKGSTHVTILTQTSHLYAKNNTSIIDVQKGLGIYCVRKKILLQGSSDVETNFEVGYVFHESDGYLDLYIKGTSLSYVILNYSNADGIEIVNEEVSELPSDAMMAEEVE